MGSKRKRRKAAAGVWLRSARQPGGREGKGKRKIDVYDNRKHRPPVWPGLSGREATRDPCPSAVIFLSFVEQRNKHTISRAQSETKIPTTTTTRKKNDRKKKRAEATIAELQAQLSMALSSASGRPFSPSTIGLSPRRPKKQWGSPRTPAPGRGKLLIRESDSRGGGYRELPPESSGQRSVSKVSMLLVPARKSGEGGNGRESAGNDCVAPPPTETTAAAGGGSRKPPRRGGDEERPSNEDRGPGVAEEEKDGDDIPELLPCGSGSEVTSGDVWGMLDSYVHRRSEVARANRHLGAIQAMRRVRATKQGSQARWR